MIKYTPDTMMELNLQLFDEAGTMVNTTTGYTNAYTGDHEAFAGKYDLSAGMKTYYDTRLLQHAKATFIYQQLGEVQSLPGGRGKIVEWRKINRLPDVEVLREAVIPKGKKLGESAVTAEITEYGSYVTISDVVDLHHVDPLLSKATEELGYSGGLTYEKLIRNELCQNTNVIYGEVVNDDGSVASIPQTRAELLTAINGGKNANLSPRMIAKGATTLTKANAPKYSGNEYLGVLNPSVTYDLRQNGEWIDYHKYAQPTEIYNGEVGKLHGVRFVETTLAPVIKPEGQAQAVYQTMIFGKGAFAVVDPQGAGMRIIHKSFAEVGGPLEQFCTVGVKFAMAAKILYPEYMVTIEHGSTEYGEIDEDNYELETEQVA